MAVTEEKNIDMLEKLPDGNFKIKYPKTKFDQVIGLGYATKAEAEAGSNNNKIMTPQSVKEAINALALPKSSITPVAGDIFTLVGFPSLGMEIREIESWFRVAGTGIKFDMIETGTIRIKFGLRVHNAGVIYARVYKNNIPTGIIRTHSTSNTTVFYTEDFTVKQGDSFSLYGYYAFTSSIVVDYQIGFANSTKFAISPEILSNS